MKLRSITLYVASILFAAFTLSSCNSDSSNPSDNTGNDNDKLVIPGVGSTYIFSETTTNLSDPLSSPTTGTVTHKILANNLTIAGHTGVMMVGETTVEDGETTEDTSYVGYLPNGDVTVFDADNGAWMVYPYASKTTLTATIDTIIEDMQVTGSTKLAYEKNESVSAASKSFNTSKINMDASVESELVTASTKGSSWFAKSIGYIVKSESTIDGEFLGFPVKTKTVMTLSSYTIK